MKKIILSAFVACMAVVSQADLANWQAGFANCFDGGGGDNAKKVVAGTAIYYFDAGLISQQDVFNAWSKGTDFSTLTGYAGSASFNSDGQANNQRFSYGEQGGKYYNFFAAVDYNDNIYLSANKQGMSLGIGVVNPAMFSWGNQSPTDGSPSSKDLPTNGYVGTGRWATIPEPTSALLMLLGMAGLAIRRRRA